MLIAQSIALDKAGCVANDADFLGTCLCSLIELVSIIKLVLKRTRALTSDYTGSITAYELSV